MSPEPQRDLPGLAPDVAERLAEGVVWVRAGRVLMLTARARRICGLGAEAVVEDRPFAALFADTAQDALDDEIARREAIERVVAGARGDDERRVVVRWIAGEGDVDVWALEDVSQRRRVESESFESARALHSARREIAGLRERHRSEAAERERLLTFVSHELRTPVTVIAGYNRLLLTGKVGELNDEQQRFLRESTKSCQRLSTFIGNLLEAARDIAADGALEVCEISLARTIAGVVTNLKPLLEEHRLEIRLDLDPHDPHARFDPLRIEQVLTNLIGNAIKYASTGSTIEISTRCAQQGSRDVVEVCVADRGPGVAAGDRERIFEPYVRVGEASAAGGLGLGLAICRRIVDAHGGTIRVEPREGGGSRFVFTLPGVHDAGAVAVPLRGRG